MGEKQKGNLKPIKKRRDGGRSRMTKVEEDKVNTVRVAQGRLSPEKEEELRIKSLKDKYSYDEERVQKLEDALKTDMTVEEACIYADLPRSTYYDWRDKIPGFGQKMDIAMKRPAMRAKIVVFADMEEKKNGNLALGYLKVRDKQFREKVSAEVQITSTEERKKSLADKIKKLPLIKGLL